MLASGSGWARPCLSLSGICSALGSECHSFFFSGRCPVKVSGVFKCCIVLVLSCLFVVRASGVRDDAKLHRVEAKGSRGLFEVKVTAARLKTMQAGGREIPPRTLRPYTQRKRDGEFGGQRTIGGTTLVSFAHAGVGDVYDVCRWPLFPRPHFPRRRVPPGPATSLSFPRPQPPPPSFPPIPRGRSRCAPLP